MRPSTLRVGTFTPSVLIEVARGLGRLEESGLDVVESLVTSSPGQFTSLQTGELDVALTSPDNVIAYHYLKRNPLGERIPMQILAGLDRGTGLSLWLAPGLSDVQDVRHGTLGVDVATSGFAFVAYALLAAAGIPREEYEVLNLGSTPKRADALLEGRCDATMLNAGNELKVTSRARRVSEVTDLGAYVGTVLCVTTSLRDESREAAQRLAGLLIELAHGVLEGTYEAEARRAATRVLGLSEADAAAHVDVLRDPARGLIPNGHVDEASVATLLSLRHTCMPDPDLDAVPHDLAGLLVGAARGPAGA